MTEKQRYLVGTVVGIVQPPVGKRRIYLEVEGNVDRLNELKIGTNCMMEYTIEEKESP